MSGADPIARLQELLVRMKAAEAPLAEECLADIRQMVADSSPEEAAALAPRLRKASELASNACTLWQQTLECAGASTWTGYGVSVEEYRGPLLRA